jgi:plasmid maintenance system antidote protein VapI
MKPEKLEVLKKELKLGRLAELAGITRHYLSKIFNGHEQASDERAIILADLSNKMTMREGYFLPSDFQRKRKKTK